MKSRRHFVALAEPDRIVHELAIMVAWRTNDLHSDPQEARVLQVMRGVPRAVEILREELGDTYSPVAVSHSSNYSAGFGYIALLAEVDASRLQALVAAMHAIGEELALQPISDASSTGRSSRCSRARRDEAGNQYWQGALGNTTWGKRQLEIIRRRAAAWRAVTPQDIQRLAARYLRRDRAYQRLLEPPADGGDAELSADAG